MRVELKEKAFDPVIITIETEEELYWMRRFIGYAVDAEFEEPGASLALSMWNQLKEI